MLQLYDGERHQLRVEAVFPNIESEHRIIALGTTRDIRRDCSTRIGITGRAVATREPQLISDVKQDPDYLEFDTRTNAELCVPMIDGDRVLGVLSVESHLKNAFDRGDLVTLKALGELAVSVILNAEQYQELRHTKGLVGARTALAWMGMASNVWRHSIDTHATTIRDRVTLIRSDLVKPNGESIETHLEIIEGLARKIQDKPITPPLSSEQGVGAVAVNGLLKERAKQWRRDSAWGSFLVHPVFGTDDTASVRASREWLRRALDVLLENSLRAVSTHNGQQRVSLSTSYRDGGIEILVSDTGPGIPVNVTSQLFAGPVNSPEKSQGLGMGLLMAQAIVATYGGTLGLVETSGEGTTMRIWLPSYASTGDVR